MQCSQVLRTNHTPMNVQCVISTPERMLRFTPQSHNMVNRILAIRNPNGAVSRASSLVEAWNTPIVVQRLLLGLFNGMVMTPNGRPLVRGLKQPIRL